MTAGAADMCYVQFTASIEGRLVAKKLCEAWTRPRWASALSSDWTCRRCLRAVAMPTLDGLCFGNKGDTPRDFLSVGMLACLKKRRSCLTPSKAFIIASEKLI